jgi:hypothetical protein
VATLGVKSLVEKVALLAIAGSREAYASYNQKVIENNITDPTTLTIHRRYGTVKKVSNLVFAIGLSGCLIGLLKNKVSFQTLDKLSLKTFAAINAAIFVVSALFQRATRNVSSEDQQQTSIPTLNTNSDHLNETSEPEDDSGSDTSVELPDAPFALINETSVKSNPDINPEVSESSDLESEPSSGISAVESEFSEPDETSEDETPELDNNSINFPETPVSQPGTSSDDSAESSAPLEAPIENTVGEGVDNLNPIQDAPPTVQRSEPAEPNRSNQAPLWYRIGGYALGSLTG